MGRLKIAAIVTWLPKKVFLFLEYPVQIVRNSYNYNKVP